MKKPINMETIGMLKGMDKSDAIIRHQIVLAERRKQLKRGRKQVYNMVFKAKNKIKELNQDDT